MQILSSSLRKKTASLSGPCAALIVWLVACSPEPAGTPGATPDATGSSAPATNEGAVPSAAAIAGKNVLRTEGIGTLRLGEAVPATGGWRDRGAQVPASCTTITSPGFPGVYAIVEAQKVQRITIGRQSDVKLREGIGVGTRETEVRAAFPNFRDEPHKYVEAPARYLTAPDAAPGRPALRFEINRDGKVSFIHVGLMPALAYVEGCS